MERKEAIEVIKKNWPDSSFTVLREALETVIPELKESEDERIWTINYLNNRKLNSSIIEEKESLKKAIAWLEKQGEQKPIDLNAISIRKLVDTYRNTDEYDEDGNHKGKPVNCMIRAYEQGIRDILKTIKQKNVNPAWCEDDEPQKELAETYLAVFDKKFPILPTLEGKKLADYKNFLNKCQQIFGLKYWSIRPLQAKLFEKLSLLWAAWGAEHLKGLGQTNKEIGSTWHGNKISDTDIEYTRTDAFIDKATEWLKKNADNYTWYNEMEGESGMTDEFIEDFRKYIKGE